MKTHALITFALFASLPGFNLQAQAPSARTNPPAGNTSRLPAGATTLRNLAYIPGGHERQKLDLFLPAQTNGPLPLIIWIHGGADPLVPHQQSEALHAALQTAGVESTLHIVKGGGHGNGFGPDVPPLVDRFFERLKTPAGTKSPMTR
jgi:acetyl esterase/lipase